MTNKIKLSFNKAWRTYDKFSHIQNKIAQTSVSLLTKYNNIFNNIGDFACGTGQSTKIILNNIRYKKCYAIDFADNLLKLAKNNNLHKNVKFILADFNEYIFNAEFFNLIFCNMGLQWSTDIVQTLLIFNSYLDYEGLLVFSIPIENNFREIKRPYRNQMHSNKNIIKFIERANFQLLENHILTHSEKFSSLYEILRSIKSTGANCSLKNKSLIFPRKDISLFFRDPKNLYLTYKIGIYIAQRNRI